MPVLKSLEYLVVRVSSNDYYSESEKLSSFDNFYQWQTRFDWKLRIMGHGILDYANTGKATIVPDSEMNDYENVVLLYDQLLGIVIANSVKEGALLYVAESGLFGRELLLYLQEEFGKTTIRDAIRLITEYTRNPWVNAENPVESHIDFLNMFEVCVLKNMPSHTLSALLYMSSFDQKGEFDFVQKVINEYALKFPNDYLKNFTLYNVTKIASEVI